jgi:hypothetical protein
VVSLFAAEPLFLQQNEWVHAMPSREMQWRGSTVMAGGDSKPFCATRGQRTRQTIHPHPISRRAGKGRTHLVAGAHAAVLRKVLWQSYSRLLERAPTPVPTPGGRQ